MLQEVLTERPPLVANGKVARNGKLSAHYRALVQRIQAANMEAPSTESLETVGVTSCAPGAGVSTVSFNIAVAAARAFTGPVLFVDTDIAKRPSRRVIPHVPTLGLADILADAADPMDCVVKTHIDNLSVIAGRGTSKHEEVSFDPFKAAEMLTELKCQFKLVVVDIPAPTELNGSIYLAGKMDGVVLVIESELSDGRAALRTKQRLVDANANLLGVVLNKRRKHMPNWLYNLL